MTSLLAQQTSSPPLPGLDGFLGTRGSLMLDVVFLAMFALLPLLAASILLVRFGRCYRLHKRLQLAMGLILLVAVGAFEVDMQCFTAWEERAAPSPYFDVQQKWTSPVGVALLVHLSFAVPTALLWIFVIARALRRFPQPPAPGPHSKQHIFWARLASLGMLLTALTGWTFYVLAFVL